MSRYEVRYVGDWISYIYDNESKEEVKISKEDFVRLLNKQEEQIADLETKLADSNESHYKNIVELTKIATEKDRKIDQLKQQLAEKEKELEEVKKSKTYIMNFGGKVKEVRVLDDNQDKISFCIEKLEKVKEVALKDFELDKSNISLARVLDKIDNQINELKKGIE